MGGLEVLEVLVNPSGDCKIKRFRDSAKSPRGPERCPGRAGIDRGSLLDNSLTQEIFGVTQNFDLWPHQHGHVAYPPAICQTRQSRRK